MFTASKSLEGASNIFVVGTKVSSIGTPNDGFLLDTLKTLFRLYKVLFDL